MLPSLAEQLFRVGQRWHWSDTFLDGEVEVVQVMPGVPSEHSYCGQVRFLAPGGGSKLLSFKMFHRCDVGWAAEKGLLTLIRGGAGGRNRKATRLQLLSPAEAPRDEQ